MTFALGSPFIHSNVSVQDLQRSKLNARQLCSTTKALGSPFIHSNVSVQDLHSGSSTRDFGRTTPGDDLLK